MAFNSQISPSFSQTAQNAASAAQSSRAQRTQVGLEAGQHAQRFAAQTMTDLKEEATRLKISPARLMEKQPGKFRGALMTLTQGDQARVDKMWGELGSYPETGAEAINWMAMERVKEITDSDSPMFDTMGIRDKYKSVEGKPIDKEAMIEEIKQAAVSGTLGPVMEKLGYTPTVNAEGQNVWPQEAHDWFQAIGDQLDVDWSGRHSDSSIQKKIMAALQSGDFATIMQEAGASALPKEQLESLAEIATETSTPGMDINNMSPEQLTAEIERRWNNPSNEAERRAVSTGGAAGRKMMMAEMSKGQTGASASGVDDLAPLPDSRTAVDYGIPATSDGKVKDGTESFVQERGKVGQISDLQGRVEREAPNVASNALLEAQAIRDAKSTTALKNAQARQLNASVEAMKAGNTQGMSERQKWLQKEMGAAYESHLAEIQDMMELARTDELDDNAIAAWNLKVQALADDLGIDTVNLNDGLTEGHLWWKKSKLPFLQLTGIMNMGSRQLELGTDGDYTGNLIDSGYSR